MCIEGQKVNGVLSRGPAGLSTQLKDNPPPLEAQTSYINISGKLMYLPYQTSSEQEKLPKHCGLVANPKESISGAH